VFSSVSPRFYFGKHSFCFLSLVAILESPPGFEFYGTTQYTILFQDSLANFMFTRYIVFIFYCWVVLHCINILQCTHLFHLLWILSHLEFRLLKTKHMNTHRHAIAAVMEPIAFAPVRHWIDQCSSENRTDCVCVIYIDLSIHPFIYYLSIYWGTGSCAYGGWKIP
jgi:hypothetical protein